MKININHFDREIKRVENQLIALKAARATYKQIVRGQETTIESKFDLRRNRSNITIKEMSLIILKENPKGLTSREILDKIKKRWIPYLTRESLTPQLSRLKIKDKKIRFKDNLWSIIV